MDNLYQRVTITLSDGTTWTGMGPAVEGFEPNDTSMPHTSWKRVACVAIFDPKPLPTGCSWGQLEEEAE